MSKILNFIISFMEFKRIDIRPARIRSEEIFNFARNRTLEKLRRKSQNNGVLERVGNELKLPHVNAESPTKEKKFLNVKKPKDVPKSSQYLRINRNENIKKYIPSEGYIEFQLEERKEKERFLPTLSKNGILFPKNHSLQFVNTEQFEKRQKLMKLSFVKNVLSLKTFLKWKKVAKYKRYDRVIYLIKTQSQPEVIRKKISIISQVMEYYQNQQEYTFGKKIAKSQNYEKTIENIIRFTEDKIDDLFHKVIEILSKEINLKVEEQKKTLIKISFYKFNELKFKQIISLIERILFRFRSLFNAVKEFDPNENIKSKENSNFFGFPQILISVFWDENKVNLTFDEDEFQGFQDHLYFKIKELIEKTVNIKITKKIKEISKIIANNLAGNNEYNCKKFDQRLYISAAKQIKSITKRNVKLMNDLIQTLEKFILLSNSSQNSLLSSFNSYRKGIQQIESYPETCFLGIFVLDLKNFKENIKSEFAHQLQKLAKKVPEELEGAFERLEAKIFEIDEIIKPTTEQTIESLLEANEEIQKFQNSVEKQISDELLRIDQELKILLQLNPKIYEPFYMTRYRLGETFKNFQIKVKNYLGNIFKRISYLTNEKVFMKKNIYMLLDRLTSDVEIFRNSEQTNPDYIKQQLKILTKTYHFLYQRKKILNDFQSLELQYFFSKVPITEMVLLEQLGRQIVIANNLMEEMDRLNLILFESNEKKNTIQNFEKFSQLKVFLIEIKNLISEGNCLNYQANFFKNQNKNFKNYEQFIEAIKIIKNSQKLTKQTENVTIKELWNKKYHIKNWQYIQMVSYKEKNISNLKHFKKNVDESLAKVYFIVDDDELEENQINFSKLQYSLELISDYIVNYDKMRNIFTNGIMNDDIEVYENATGQILTSIRNLERVQFYLRYMKRIQQTYNNQINFLKQEVFRSGKEELTSKWNLIYCVYRNTPLNKLYTDKKLFEILNDIEELMKQIEEELCLFFQIKIEEFPLFAIVPRFIIYKSLASPLSFLDYFFKQMKEIKIKQNTIHIQTFDYEKIDLDLQNMQKISNRSIFREIENYIFQKLSDISDLKQSQDDLLNSYFDPYFIGCPLQIMNFFDCYFLQNIKEDEVNREITELSLKIRNNSFQKNLPHQNKEKLKDKIKYHQKLWQLLIINRIQKRDYLSLKNKKESFQMQQITYHHRVEEENEESFTISFLNKSIDLSYQLTDYRQACPIFCEKVWFSFFSILSTISESTIALISKQNKHYILSASTKLMKYYLIFQNFNDNLLKQIQILNKMRVILHFQVPKNETIEDVDLKLEKYERLNKTFYEANENYLLPLFVTLREEESVWKTLEPKYKYKYRNINFVKPKIGVLIQVAAYLELESKLSQKMLILIRDEKMKNNQYRKKDDSNFYRILLETLKKVYFVLDYNQISYTEISIIYLVRQLLSIATNYRKSSEKNFLDVILDNVIQIMSINPIFKESDYHDLISKIMIKKDRTFVTSKTSLQGSKKVIESHPTISSITLKKQKLVKNKLETKLKDLDSILQTENIIMIIGGHLTGKTFLLDLYLQEEEEKIKMKIEKIVINPKITGKTIWNIQNEFFKILDNDISKKFLVFTDNCIEQQYPFYDYMIKNQRLYYENGQTITFQNTTKIIFQISSTEDMSPTVFSYIKYIHCKENQFTWQDILTSKIKLMNKRITQSIQQKYDAELKVNPKLQTFLIKLNLNEIVVEITNLIEYFWQNIRLSDFLSLSWLTEKQIILNTCKLFQTFMSDYENKIDLMIREKQFDKQDLLLFIKTVKKDFLYCFYWTLYFSFNLKMKSQLQKKFLLLYNLFDKSAESPSLENFHFYENGIPHQIPIEQYSFNSENSNQNYLVIQTNQNKVYYYFLKKIIKNKQSILAIGKEFTGKSKIIRKLTNSKIYYCFTLNCSAEKIQQIILSQREKKREFIHIEDLNLDNNSNVHKYLKYFTENFFFFDTKNNVVQNLQTCSFISEVTLQDKPIPKEYYHFYPINIQINLETFQTVFSQLCFKKIGLLFGPEIEKVLNIPEVIYKLYFRKYTDGLAACSNYFAPNSFKDWYHLYDVNLFKYSIDLFFRRMQNEGIYLSTIRLKNIKESKEDIKQFVNTIIGEINFHLTDCLIQILLLRFNIKQKNSFLKLINKNLFGSQKYVEKQEEGNNIKKKLQQILYRNDMNEKIKISDSLINNMKKIEKIFHISLKRVIFINSIEWYYIGNLFQFYRQNFLKDTQIIDVKESFSSYQDYKKFIYSFIEKQEWKIQSNNGNLNLPKVKNEQMEKKTIYHFYSFQVVCENYEILNYIKELQSEIYENNYLVEVLSIIQFVEQDKKFINSLTKNRKNLKNSLTVILQHEKEQTTLELMKEILSETLADSPNSIESLHHIYLNIKNELYGELFILNKSVQNRQKMRAQKIEKEISTENIFTMRNFVEFLKIFKTYFTNQERNSKEKYRTINLGNIEIQRLMKSYQSLEKQVKDENMLLSRLKNDKDMLSRSVHNLENEIQNFNNSENKRNVRIAENQIKNANKQIQNFIKKKNAFLNNSIHFHSAITRQQLSQFKYILNTNFNSYSELFISLTLAVAGESEHEFINKVFNDVNLMGKIKEMTLSKVSLEVIKSINKRIKNQKSLLNEDQKEKVSKNLVQWLYNASQYEIYRHQEPIKIAEMKKKIEENENFIKQIEAEYKIEYKARLLLTKQQEMKEIILKIDQKTSKINKMKHLLERSCDIGCLKEVKEYSIDWLRKLENDLQMLIPNCLYISFGESYLTKFSGEFFLMFKRIIIKEISKQFSLQVNFVNKINLSLFLEESEEMPSKMNILNSFKSKQRKIGNEEEMYKSVSKSILKLTLKKSMKKKHFFITKNRMMKILAFLFHLKVLANALRNSTFFSAEPIIVISQEEQFLEVLNKLIFFFNQKQKENNNLKKKNQIFEKSEEQAWQKCLLIQIDDDQWDIQAQNRDIEDYFKCNEKVYWIGKKKIYIPENSIPIFMKKSIGKKNINPYYHSYAFRNYKIINFEMDGEDKEENILTLIYQLNNDQYYFEYISFENNLSQIKKQCLKIHLILHQISSELSIYDASVLKYLIIDVKEWKATKENNKNTLDNLELDQEIVGKFSQLVCDNLMEIYQQYQLIQWIQGENPNIYFGFRNYMKLIENVFKTIQESSIGYDKFDALIDLVQFQLAQKIHGRQFTFLMFVKQKKKSLKNSQIVSMYSIENFLSIPDSIKTIKHILNSKGNQSEISIMKEMIDEKQCTFDLENVQQLLSEGNLNERIVEKIISKAKNQLSEIQSLEIKKFLFPNHFYQKVHNLVINFRQNLFQKTFEKYSSFYENNVMVCQCEVGFWKKIFKNKNVQFINGKLIENQIISSMDFQKDAVKFVIAHEKIDKIVQNIQIKKNFFSIKNIIILFQSNSDQNVQVLAKIIKLYWKDLVDDCLYQQNREFFSFQESFSSFRPEEIINEFLDYKHFQIMYFQSRNSTNKVSLNFRKSFLYQKRQDKITENFMRNFFQNILEKKNHYISIYDVKRILKECRLKLNETIKNKMNEKDLILKNLQQEVLFYYEELKKELNETKNEEKASFYIRLQRIQKIVTNFAKKLYFFTKLKQGSNDYHEFNVERMNLLCSYSKSQSKNKDIFKKTMRSSIGTKLIQNELVKFFERSEDSIEG